MAFRDAVAAAPAASAGALEARQALGLSRASGPMPTASPAERSKERLVQYSQQTQFVGGKNFFQNDQQWIDSAVHKHQDAKRVRIQFASTEYFELAAKHAEALPWLALGQNVQFVLNGTVYEIYE